MEAEKNDEQVVSVAIRRLKTLKDIQQFYCEYVVHLRHTGKKASVRKYPCDTANANIGWVISDFGKEENRKWRKAIPGIYHPVLG